MSATATTAVSKRDSDHLQNEDSDFSAPPPYLLLEKKWNFKQCYYFLTSFILTEQYVLLSFINFIFSCVLALFYTQANTFTFVTDLKNNRAPRPFFENIKRNVYLANRENEKQVGGAELNQRQNFMVNLDYILFFYAFISLNRLVLASITAIEHVRREVDSRNTLVDHIILENSANCQRYLSLELEADERAFQEKNKRVREKNDRLCPTKNYPDHEERKRDVRYELAFVRRKKIIRDTVDEEESFFYMIVFLFVIVVFFILSGVQLRAANFFKGMVVIFPFVHLLVLFMILKLGNSSFNKRGNPLFDFVSKGSATNTNNNNNNKNNNNQPKKKNEKEESGNENTDKYFYFQKSNPNQNIVYRVDKKSVHRINNKKLQKVQFYCLLVENTIFFFSLVYIALAVV